MRLPSTFATSCDSIIIPKYKRWRELRREKGRRKKREEEGGRGEKEN